MTSAIATISSTDVHITEAMYQNVVAGRRPGALVSDVVDALDLSGIYAAYESGERRGQPRYHPAMMVKLLVYGYCIGTGSCPVLTAWRSSDLSTSLG